MRKRRRSARVGRPPKFSSALRARRERVDRTLAEVAGKTGLTAPTVARAEAGLNISLRTIDALVGYYGRGVLRLLVRPP
jgi:transcriptional regulator with XRE-family HTH domain